MTKSLREWRTAQLLSIKDVASAVQVTTKTLTDLEYGRRRATERSARPSASRRPRLSSLPPL